MCTEQTTPDKPTHQNRCLSASLALRFCAPDSVSSSFKPVWSIRLDSTYMSTGVGERLRRVRGHFVITRLGLIVHGRHGGCWVEGEANSLLLCLVLVLLLLLLPSPTHPLSPLDVVSQHGTTRLCGAAVRSACVTAEIKWGKHEVRGFH